MDSDSWLVTLQIGGLLMAVVALILGIIASASSYSHDDTARCSKAAELLKAENYSAAHGDCYLRFNGKWMLHYAKN